MTEKELVEAVLERANEAAQLVRDYKEDSVIADELSHALLSIMINANRWLFVRSPLNRAPQPRPPH